MSGRLLPDTLTPVTCRALFNALSVVWEEMGIEPKRAAIELKVVHINAEVGAEFQACHCHNLGNIKALVLGVHGWTGDYTMFECGEELAVQQYDRVIAQYRAFAGSVTIKSNYIRKTKSGPVRMLSVKFKPPHPWSRFRAFENLFDGVRSQLSYLEHHPKVLDALMSGDVETYNRALAEAGYYTADPGVYLNLLKRRVPIIQRESAAYDWGDVG